MRVASALLASFLAAQPASAQVLGGTVLDSASGKPVVGARVVVLDSAGKGLFAAVTGADGKSVSTFHRPAITDYESAGSATQRASPNRLTSAQPYLRPRWCDWRLRRSHLIPWSS